MDHHHRSSLKQNNKKFKQGSNSSKRSVKRLNKGKVNSVKVAGAGGNESGNRADRINAAKQARNEQRKQQIKQGRGIAGTLPPPRLVALLASTKTATVSPVKRAVLSKSADEMSEDTSNGPESALLGKSGQRVTAVECPKDLLAFLDLMMVSDILGLVVSDTEDQDAVSTHMVHAGKLYGLPTSIFVVVQGISKKPATVRQQILKRWESALEKSIGREIKAFADSLEDSATMLRFLSNTKLSKRPSWQSRPLILAHEVKAAAQAGEAAGGEEEASLAVSGYVRCAPLSVNQLSHIPSHGSYQISRIVVHGDPLSEKQTILEEQVFDFDPSLQESLEMEQEVDEMDAEQTWPTEEEMMGKKKKKRVPVGIDDIQAAWEIPSDDEEENSEDDGMREEEEEEEEEEAEVEEEEEEEEGDSAMLEETGTEADGEGDEFLRKRRAAKDEDEFPDEVDTPADVAARVRFQKYRGLKSLRSSPWDPLENLPLEYAKIANFNNPNASRLRALTEGKTGVPVGSYVTVYVKVPLKVATAVAEASGAGSSKPLVMGGLLKYENKMTMMHYDVSRCKDDGEVVKSKEPIIMVCGMRRMEVRPLYSEERARSDKHKMLRYFPGRGACVASAYAPTAWAPQPVLLLRRMKSGALTLLAAGKVKGANVNRIALKRIVLTGLPFKIHKRKATARWMFFQPDDIRWFKPVELWTKEGRRGHIKEPLGTHGYMKCIFDAPISYSDTVCMSLYKRVFPPYPALPALQLA